MQKLAARWNSSHLLQNFPKQTVNTAQSLHFINVSVRMDGAVDSVTVTVAVCNPIMAKTPRLRAYCFASVDELPVMFSL
jgi:hypothetical protein